MKSRRIWMVLVCAMAAVSATNSLGQQNSQKTESTRTSHSHVHELNGFLLRQDQEAFEAALGKAFHAEKMQNGLNACAYHISGSRQNYLVAFFLDQKDAYQNGKAVRLELTGSEPSGPTGFFGLRLGDSGEKVEAVLGKPTDIRHEDDVNLDLWDYKQENYSLEFTAAHKLYSIQINDEQRGSKVEEDGTAETYDFASAIKTHNNEELMSLASGEIECAKKEAFGIQNGNAQQILDDAKSKVSVCLAEAADAVLALGPDMKGVHTEIRIWEKGPPGMVVKFPKESPLLEVVLVDEAGSPRVYEVTFR